MARAFKQATNVLILGARLYAELARSAFTIVPAPGRE